MRQQSFELKTWGGKRKGAGRKPAAGREGIRHDARDPVRASQPVHVTMRMAEHVWSLRSERSFRIIQGALHAVRARRDFRVVHFSVQGNHVHLVVEADGTPGLANGMRALSIRLALRLNAMMERSGPVFSARYHTHVLKTPAEVKNAIRYVLRNFASHAARRGERLSERYVDRFSSASGQGARVPQLSLFESSATREARSWLLRTAFRPCHRALADGLDASPWEVSARDSGEPRPDSTP
jgi:REP-associated tyrosine transposase